MKEKNSAKRTKRTRPSFALITVWSVIGLLTLFRVGYDLSLYFYGGTVVVRHTVPYDYLIHFPAEYHDFDGPRPLIVFLHGAGEVGADVTQLKNLDVVHFAQSGPVAKEDFPFIAVSPVTPKHGWEPQRVKLFLDKLIQSRTRRFKIDPNRVYLTGFSMGGFGTFRTAEEYPDLFAAVAPVAGGGDVEKAERLKSVPIWAFHGDADDVVDYHSSADIIQAVQKAGNRDARLTTVTGGTHGICPNAYGRAELYRWMLRHRKR